MTNIVRYQSGVSPEHWRDWAYGMPAAPNHASFNGGFVQRWNGTSPVMRQPALDHHLIVLHLGGPKRVERNGGGKNRIVDVAENACTTVESGSIYGWRTEGPIAFAHIYVRPQRFADIVAQNFDRDPATVGFAETIGRFDPNVVRMTDLILNGMADPDWSSVGDYYIDELLIRLASTSTVEAEFRLPRRLALTRPTVARVRDYIHSNLDQRITLGDLADVAGYSRYHFVRAFKESTGMPPYAFLLSERVRAAQELLRTSDEPIAEVALRSGFGTHAQFSSRFRELTGITPAEYRRLSRD